MIQNTAELRSFNTKRIIDYLRCNDSATKNHLSDRLGLCFATVSNICNQLISDGILENVLSPKASGGRIPQLLLINPSSKYTLALDLTNKGSLDLAVVNLKSEVVAAKRVKSLSPDSIQRLLETIVDLSRETLSELQISSDRLLGIGVAAPGILYSNTECLINSTNPLFENMPLKSMLEKAFNLPIEIENESNLLAMAESLFRRSDETYNKDIVYLFVGEGIGVGIISNGKLLTGSRGLGGEISHIPIGERNYLCTCGHCGCVETELALHGFLRKYMEDKGIFSSSTSRDWDGFVKALLSGDTIAQAVLAENGRIFGKLISILINIFDPEVVYLGGITEAIFEHLYPHIDEEVRSRVIVPHLHKIPILKSVNYQRLIFKGCGELVFSKWKPGV